MSKSESNRWRLNRQVNISVLMQLMILASLIVGSWFNLQRQLDLLQRDMTQLIESNGHFQQKLQTLGDKSIAFEYRIRAVEKLTSQTQITEGDY